MKRQFIEYFSEQDWEAQIKLEVYFQVVYVVIYFRKN